MASIFISYSRRRQQVVETLIGDIEGLGHAVWFDKELTGGKPWWDGILAQIRGCEVFVLAVSPETLESKACKREWRYAADLGKTILPVLITPDVTPDALPVRLQAIQSVDYRKLDRVAALGLARAFNTLPASKPLPEPLPPAPEVPISDLATLRDLIDADAPLTQVQQTEIVAKLRRLSREPGTSVDAFNLLRAMKQRSDLFADIDDDIEELLKAGPSATPVAATPKPTPTPVPKNWVNRLRFAVAGAILGGMFGLACMTYLMFATPNFRNDAYVWALLPSGAAAFVGLASAGRPRSLLYVLACGAIGFAGTIIVGFSSRPIDNVIAGLVIFQPAGWVAGIALAAVLRFVLPARTVVVE